MMDVEEEIELWMENRLQLGISLQLRWTAVSIGNIFLKN
jgi:hypothetical protein